MSASVFETEALASKATVKEEALDHCDQVEAVKKPVVVVDQKETFNYSNVAAKTVANIKRLQENVLSVNISSSASNYNVSTVAIGGVANAGQCTGDPVQPTDEPTPPQELNNCQNPSPASALSYSAAAAAKSPTSPSPISVSPDLTASFNALVTLDPNWQASRTTLRERNRVMCNNALMADIYFNIGGKKFPCHKYVLATGSTVFFAMFYGGYTEANADTIDVPDVDPDAFVTMLKYLYCDEIDLCPDNVLATLYTAKKYLVPALANACVAFLEQSLTAKNACLLLSQARLFSEPALTQRAWEVIDAQAELALTSEAFADIDFDTLETILSRETLNCKETVMFVAADNWATAECKKKGLDSDLPENRRSVLGRVLRKIRFAAMSVTDFADTVAMSGIYLTHTLAIRIIRT
jgi:BTB/POZ domain-containing protein 3/6